MSPLVALTAQISLVIAVFALGLTTRLDELVCMFRRPGKLLRALLSMIVIMPVVAFALVFTFDLRPPVKIALIALSVSPVPALVPRRIMKAGGGEHSYAIGLLVAASVLSIIWVPLFLELFQLISGVPLQMPVAAVARLAMISVLLPLITGAALRAVFPEFARRIAAPCSTVAMILLTIALIPALVQLLGAALVLVGDGTLAALIGFGLVGLAAGHLLGGPLPHDRQVLAVYTMSRHPGIAITIAQVNFPRQQLVLPVIILAVLIGAILSRPYLSWTKRHFGAPASAE